MNIFDVDLFAVLITGIAGFAVSFLWYHFMKKDWLEAVGKSEEDMKMEPKNMIVSFAAQLVMAFVINIVGLAMSFNLIVIGPDIVESSSPGVWGGIMIGGLMWLGFVITTMQVNHMFQGVKPALTRIDGGHWLAVLIVMGLVSGLIAG